MLSGNDCVVIVPIVQMKKLSLERLCCGPMFSSEWSWDRFIPVQVQAFIFHDCSRNRLVLSGHGTPFPGPCSRGAMVCVFSVTGKLLTF